jgi:hypothetical protein
MKVFCPSTLLRLPDPADQGIATLENVSNHLQVDPGSTFLYFATKIRKYTVQI